MDKLAALKEIIINKVIPETINLSISTKKPITQMVEIEDGQNLNTLTETISKIATEYDISVDKIYIGVDQNYDGGTFCAYFDTIGDKTPKEIEKEEFSLVESKAWKIILSNMTKKGFKRVGCSSSLFKQFDDTSVYKMIKDNNIDRLISYYAFRYDIA